MYRLAARMRSTPPTTKFAMVARRPRNNSGAKVFRASRRYIPRGPIAMQQERTAAKRIGCCKIQKPV
jgi:hypothetical protein